MPNKHAIEAVEQKDYDVAVKKRMVGQEVLDAWDSVETQYSQVFNQMSMDRSFYDGDATEQWNIDPEGSLKLVFNVGATVIDLYTYMLTNTPPQVQFRPVGSDKVSQTVSDFGEVLTNKLLYDANFKTRFKDSARQYFMLGQAALFPFWNKGKTDGGDKGTLDLSSLNPFTTRIIYTSTDYDEVESVITYKRMTPKAIKKRFKVDVSTDREARVLPQSINSFDDDMTGIFRMYTDEDIITVANGVEIDREKHNYGFVPVVPVHNLRLINDAQGNSEIKRWKSVCQEINALLTAISEISRDLGYPPVLEYNKALGGKKLGKLRGKKIPVRRSDRGEGLEYLNNPAQIQPMIEQVQMLLDLFHFISLMPKAASGVFPNNVTSGFQAKLSMQPATLAVASRQIDWEDAVRKLIKMSFKILEKNNPEALTIKLDDGKEMIVDNLHQHQIDVIFSDNLPIDVAREIQNLTLGLQANLTSISQAIDRYNALMDMGSPADTKQYLKDEADDLELSPDRAGKIQKLKAELASLGQQLQEKASAVGQMGAQAGAAGPAQPPQNPMVQAQAQGNMNNMALANTSPMAGETRPVAPTAREAVNPNSTGGMVIPPSAPLGA